jgi:phage terminase large subunit-like protein
MPDYVQLILPMEYESGRHCTTEIGFSDPRSSDGELLFPARWGRQEVENLKRDMDKWAWCTPQETPILMGDLSMRRIAEVEVGDEVIGIFVPENEGRAYRRRRLLKATVIAKDHWVRPVVRATLDSGRVIRCTADHRWMSTRGNRGHFGHAEYLPLAIGRPLLRICDPEIPAIDNVEDAREAGWLAGFFDGEGSVSLNRKHGDLHPPSSLISFTQGAGRNLHLCERLERALTRFGFDFGFGERVRSDRRVVGADTPMMRHYWLRGNDLPMFQRFLHVVKPMKWRERMIQGALGTQFMIGREKVVSIEPDGEEEVFGLTTTTGNYVAWGLASANSGQYQQRPAPRGGGLFPYNGWELWSRSIAVTYGRNESQYPDFDVILGSLDSAYGMKQENDYSAFIVLGIWTNHFGVQQAMLMACWQKRLGLSDLVEEVIKSCRKLKVDRLLIELKASGISVAQEVSRLTRDEEFAVQRIDPGNMDKVSRAHALSHLWGEEQADGSVRKGVVWAPGQTQSHGAVWPRDWAELCMSQCASFPKGKHDDIVDALCQALKWCRDRGLLKKSAEVQQEEYAELMASPLPPVPLYPI